ncbi:hypothetical protein CMI42_06315, partial [Candidatus Pacearchaeota archaeon]|nr:hypothetical protein [Candidatus Pacearchaeota archaeon]
RNNSKRIIASIMGLFIVFSFVGSVFAITGEINNARMILRVDQGDIIKKHIQVNNVNDVSVDVELSVIGDLEKYIDIKDESFRLDPGEDKRAYFDIKAAKSGSTESKINIKFSPVDGGNGVGLSSTIIVIAKEKEGFFESLFNGDDEDKDDGEGVSFGKKEDPGVVDDKPVESGNSALVMTGVSTVILFVVLLVLVLLAAHFKKNKNKSGSSRKSKIKESVRKDE